MSRPEIADHISNYIAARRKHLGFSLDHLASRMGCSKSHIWELEKGRLKNPTLWMALSLCDGLNCSLNELIGRDVSQPLFSSSEIALIDAHRQIFADPTPTHNQE
jgi:transcriptional regulator with XRE-family HTH domain